MAVTALVRLLLAFQHSSLQGILISILEPNFFNVSRDITREDAGQSGTGLLQWSKTAKNWLRIDRYYGTVIFLDAILFMLIHVGKPIHELGFHFPPVSSWLSSP